MTHEQKRVVLLAVELVDAWHAFRAAEQARDANLAADVRTRLTRAQRVSETHARGAELEIALIDAVEMLERAALAAQKAGE